MVAGEIQKLSVNSKKASDNINTIVEESRSAVAHGKELVERTQNTIANGILYSEQNTEMVKEIGAAIQSRRMQSMKYKQISKKYQIWLKPTPPAQRKTVRLQSS